MQFDDKKCAFLCSCEKFLIADHDVWRESRNSGEGQDSALRACCGLVERGELIWVYGAHQNLSFHHHFCTQNIPFLLKTAEI